MQPGMWGLQGREAGSSRSGAQAGFLPSCVSVVGLSLHIPSWEMGP